MKKPNALGDGACPYFQAADDALTWACPISMSVPPDELNTALPWLVAGVCRLTKRFIAALEAMRNQLRAELVPYNYTGAARQKS